MNIGLISGLRSSERICICYPQRFDTVGCRYCFQTNGHIVTPFWLNGRSTNLAFFTNTAVTKFQWSNPLAGALNTWGWNFTSEAVRDGPLLLRITNRRSPVADRSMSSAPITWSDLERQNVWVTFSRWISVIHSYRLTYRTSTLTWWHTYLRSQPHRHFKNGGVPASSEMFATHT